MDKQVTVASSEVALSSVGEGVFEGSPLCTLVTPNSLLLHLHANGNKYIGGINKAIKGKMVTLDESCTRLETTMKKVSGRLASQLRKCKGSRDRNRIRDGSTNFLVGVGETVVVEEVQQTLEVCAPVCMNYA